ncbi:MAG TPA: hypothetical protein VMT46_10840 [Anaerolineaceae bacterium]|nr:hypothetical protein [Anaerolineaceae bacterium]
MRTIRASEIGVYLFCRRAWWYQGQGLLSENQAELASGTSLHHQHSRRVLAARLLRGMAFVLLLAALVALTLYAFQLLF